MGFDIRYSTFDIRHWISSPHMHVVYTRIGARSLPAIRLPGLTRSSLPAHLLFAVVVDRPLTLHDEIPVQPMGRLPVMAVGRCHLPGGLAVGHAAEPRPHRREGCYLKLLLGNAVVGVDRQKSRPGGIVDLVGSLDAAGDSHRRG